MSWFSRGKHTEPEDYAPPVLEVHPADGDRELDLLPAVRQLPQFAPKPSELTDALDLRRRPLGASEWQRPGWLTLPSSTALPTRPGLYYWRSTAGPDPGLWAFAMVVDFGGQLCTRRRRGDHSMFVSVSQLAWEWSGPCPIPEGARLEDLEVGHV